MFYDTDDVREYKFSDKMEWCFYHDNRLRSLFNGVVQCSLAIDREILFDYGELGCYEPSSACDKAFFIWCI